jgi:hypothetical protein
MTRHEHDGMAGIPAIPYRERPDRAVSRLSSNERARFDDLTTLALGERA